MRFLIFVLLALPSFASAEVYYWRGGVSAGAYVFDWTGADPMVGCEEFAQTRSASVTGTNYYSSGTRFSCITNASSSPSSLTFFRYGNECPAGSTYNAETFTCEAPEEDPCLPTTGNLLAQRLPYGEISSSGSVTQTSPPPDSVCSGSCTYGNRNIVDVFRFQSGSPNGVWADYEYFGTGATCVAGTPVAVSAPEAETKPESSETNSCTTKVCLESDADGNCIRYTYSCTATEIYIDPGKLDCDHGQVDGESVCVPNSPSPKMTETTTTTELEEKTNSDGSKDATTTTTTKTTDCSGADPCKTTTTTTTNVTHTNADGTEGGSSESCTGSSCKDADGKTQEDREEEEESESKVTGENCEVPVACQGDAVQCAILRQQKEDRCAFEEAMDYETNKDQIDQLLTGDEYQLEEETYQIPSFVEGSTRFLPTSGCPAPGRATLSSGRVLEMDYQPFCDFATGISPVVVACALLFAALFVGRGLGGS
jgi:hypothetical protein